MNTAAYLIGCFVILVGAGWFFYNAEEHARYADALSRRFGMTALIPQRTHATVVKAMALIIAGTALVALVLAVLGGHS